MPTVEQVIKRVTIIGESRGLDKLSNDTRRLTADQQKLVDAAKALEQQTAATAKAMVVYNDRLNRDVMAIQSYRDEVIALNDNQRETQRSIGLTSDEFLTLAGHIKTVAFAAYTLSPAFRAAVNPALITGLGLTGKALAAMSPSAASVAVAVGSRMLPALSTVARVAIPIAAVSEAFKFMSYSTELAKDRGEEWSAIADKANQANFSTSYFQRLTKVAKEARQPIEDLTAALKQFDSASEDKLGGSDLQNRLKNLTKAGNFKGNTGVGAVAVANDSEQRLRAVVDLIGQAMERGERLAAIDLAGVFGPKVQDALRNDSGYLNAMLIRADQMAKTKLISDEDIGRAQDLKLRMETAQELLANKWKPLQDDIARLGMNYHQSWVEITEQMAKAVGYATDLYTELKKVPSWSSDKIGNASVWKTITDTTGAMGLNSTPQAAGITMKDDPAFGQTEANAKLAAAMKNRFNITNAMKDATETYSRVLGDNSKAITGDARAHAETNDAVDRAINSVTRQIEQQKAAAQAIGLNVGEQAALKVAASETAAVLANGGKITDEQAKAFARLKVEASDAALALGKANLAGDIKWDRSQIGLSDSEQRANSRLRSVFGDDLTSAQAQFYKMQISLNASLKPVNDNKPQPKDEKKEKAA